MNVQLLMGLSHKPQCSYSLRHPSSAFDPYVELISNPLERDDSIKQRMSFFFSLLLLLFQLTALQFSVFIKESTALWMPLRVIKSNYLVLAVLIAVRVFIVVMV